MEIDIINFVFGIIASLIATIIVSSLRNQSIRFLRFKAIKSLSNDEIAFKGDNLDSISKLLMNSIHNSQELRVYSNRGNFLTNDRGTLNAVLSENNLQSIRCLLAGESDFLEERAAEYCKLNNGYEVKNYLEDVARSIEILTKLSKENERLQIREHIQPITFRFILTNNHLFISYFERNKPAKETEVLVYANNAKTYHGFDRYFETVWRNSNKK